MLTGATAQPKHSEGVRPRDHKKNRFRDFKRETGGLAALEFALILPVLIGMLFGMGELSLAVFARTDITQIASTVADLVAQESTVAGSDFTNVYNAAGSILFPYYDPSAATGSPKLGKVSIRISSVVYDTVSHSDHIGKVAWSCAQAGNASYPLPAPGSGARSTNSTVTLTESLNQAVLTTGSSVVMVEVAYSYSSPTSQLITGPVVMTDQFYTKPRRVGQIPAPSSCS